MILNALIATLACLKMRVVILIVPRLALIGPIYAKLDCRLMQTSSNKDNNNNNNNSSSLSNSSSLTGPSLVTPNLAGNPREGGVGCPEEGHFGAGNPQQLVASWIQHTRRLRT